MLLSTLMALGLTAGGSAGPTAQDGLLLCAKIERNVRALIDWTTTECQFGTNADGGFDLILVSSQPVFSVEASRKAWMLVAIAATAEATRTSSTRTGQLVMTDRNLVADRKGYAIDTAAARSIQGRMKRDELALDDALAEIGDALRTYKVKP